MSEQGGGTMHKDTLKKEIAKLEETRKKFLTDEFFTHIKARDEFANRQHELKEAKESLGRDYNKLSYSDKAKMNQEVYHTYVNKRYHIALLNEPKAEMAKLALKISELKDELNKAEGVYVQYSEPTLGNLYSVGELEIGSKAWHDERLLGIGGSDVGKLLTCGYLNRYNEFKSLPISEYSAVGNWHELAQLKAGVIAKDVSDDDRDDLSSAANRGAYNEDYIRHLFAQKHPELQVVVCKDSWRGVDCEYAHANFDGLIANKDDSRVNQILEIKTGTTVEKDYWGESGDFANCPFNYQMQAIWYAHWAGLNGGYVAALLDEHDYREYPFSFTDTYVQDLLKLILSAMAKFWSDVQEYKTSQMPKPKRLSAKGFPVALNKAKELEYIKILMDLDSDSDAEDFVSLHAGKSKVSAKDVRMVLQNVVPNAVKGIPLTGRTHKFIGIDLECNNIAPSLGTILETAMVEFADDNGSLKTLVNELSGLNEQETIGCGVGAEDVHHISIEMIAKQKRFANNKDLHKKILNLLRGNVLVAHNAAYELGFLATWLPGFAKMVDEGEIFILDTMNLTKWYLGGENNKLETFCNELGIKYENAHRSLQDTNMMMQALFNFVN